MISTPDVRWGDIATLEYGKSLRDYRNDSGDFRVYGTNGPIGWHSEALCAHPGVIIGRKGAYRGIHYSDKPFFVIDTAFYLKPKQGVDLDLKWAYYELLTKDINGMDSGSAIPSTSRDAFYSLLVRFPPIEEQKAIAKILSSMDDKVELNRRMNATLEAMARALFKAWFVDFEPVHANLDNRPSTSASPEISKLFPSDFENGIPKGWEERSLDKAADFLNGLALQKFPPESDDEFLPVIKIAQLRKGNTDGSDKASKYLKPEYIVHDGDVLFSWSGSLEVEIWCGGDGALNQHLFKVTSKNYPKWFYFLWTRFHLADFRETAAHKATTMGHIQRYHLKDANVLVPNAELLGEMTTQFEPIFETLIGNNKEARTLVKIRDSLLPRLISGRIRIND